MLPLCSVCAVPDAVCCCRRVHCAPLVPIWRSLRATPHRAQERCDGLPSWKAYVRSALPFGEAAHLVARARVCTGCRGGRATYGRDGGTGAAASAQRARLAQATCVRLRPTVQRCAHLLCACVQPRIRRTVGRGSVEQCLWCVVIFQICIHTIYIFLVYLSIYLYTCLSLPLAYTVRTCGRRKQSLRSTSG